MSQKLKIRTGVLSALVLLIALSRLLPHPPNFTPVGAMALFGAAYFHRKSLAFVIPFLAMWISDLLLNNMLYRQLYPEFYNGFSWFGSIWVYASFALIVIIGFVFLKKVNLPRLLGASLSASTLFFLITNFGVWMSSVTLPKTFEGLMTAYTLGIPFFWNTLIGDLFFTALLFGSFELVRRNVPTLQLAK
ncbi:MAG: DUF6580 family putative transport protein [Bacteroidota bacterium]